MCNTMPETSMIPSLIFIAIFVLVSIIINYLYRNYYK